jgi:hypothetical protein
MKMGIDSEQQEQREIRAARNQSLFRAVNENLKGLNEAFASVTETETFTIACECSDVSCVEMLEIHPHEYVAVRSEPRHFAILPGHVDLEAEKVVREAEGYVVVEKIAAAGDEAELLASEAPASR